MLLAGIVGYEEKAKTAGLISSFLVSRGKRVSVADSSGLGGLDIRKLRGYILELERNKTDVLLLKLQEQDVEKLIKNGICVDVMICTGSSEIETAADAGSNVLVPDRLDKLMSEKGISIVNADDVELLSMLGGMKQHVVTYGFNSRASVTTSSIGDPSIDGSFLCCLQQAIPAQNGELIEPQEYKLKLEPGEFNTHHILAAASFAIVNGVDINGFNFV